MKLRKLNGNVIKIIAAIAMLIDHTGLFLFPHILIFRIIGRLSMPLFAFFVAEGCRYTRNKYRHALLVGVLGLFYNAVYYLVYRFIYLSIFTTFTLSIFMIYALQNFKKSVFCGEHALLCVLNGVIFFSLVAFTYALNCITTFGKVAFVVDYGFWGCMLPVFAALFDLKGVTNARENEKDNYFLRYAAFAVGLVLMCLALSKAFAYSYWALASLVPLAFYNGKRGKYNLKWAFYLFYPLHMALLFGIYALTSGMF